MIRGLWQHAGVLYSVEDSVLYSIDGKAARTWLGQLNSSAGPVDFASNLTQLIVNDGTFLYVYTPGSGDFTIPTGYSGGDRISFIDQRLIYLFRGTQKFGWSDLGNALSLPALNFASAEGSPDPLIAQVTTSREIVLFGTDSTEIWASNGSASDSSSAFTRTTAAIDYGCVAAQSAQKRPTRSSGSLKT